MDLHIKIDDRTVADAWSRAAPVMVDAIDPVLARGAQKMADAARAKAPMSFSTLAQSIKAVHVAPLHYRVVVGVNYARAVEEGTGPAAGNPNYYPNPDSLLQYLMNSPSRRGFKWARPGSGKREGQRHELWWRSRAFAWYIYQHGTKAQPFMAPALAENEAALVADVRSAALRAAQEVFGG